MCKRLDALASILLFAATVAVVLAGGWCLSHSIERAHAEMEPTPIPVAQPCITLPEPTPTPTPEPEEPTYRPDIPLSPELQRVLYEACEEAGVPVALALGLIQVESCFDPEAVSKEGCYGLTQLNPRYFAADLDPADNLRTGIGHLGSLLEQYGDTGAALTAYNAGHDTGPRGYADAVLAEAEWWGEVVGHG